MNNMKKMSKTELLRYIAETVLTYEKLEVTRNIIWDYMSNSSKLISWMCSFREREPIIIAIRMLGVEIGDKESGSDRLRTLGPAIHTIEVSKIDGILLYEEFNVKEY